MTSKHSICPHCQQGHLVQRTRKRDGLKFWGCSDFPKCKYSGSIGEPPLQRGRWELSPDIEAHWYDDDYPEG
jgi:ssDNA-binding Zn-finger/Zn-ribbon topoisomerase 1